MPRSTTPWAGIASSVLGLAPWIGPLALAPSFVAALAIAASWPIFHDTPLFLYSGFLMNQHGLVPYLDLFEMNPPGTLYFNAAYYALFGADPGAFRLVHLSWLAATLVGIVQFARRWGLAAATTAAMSFAIAYASTGRESAFQREFQLILPLTGSLLLAFPRRATRTSASARSFAIGLLFGIAACIKPAIAFGLPFLMVGFVFAHSNEQAGWRAPILRRSTAVWAAWNVLGFAAAPLGFALLLVNQGALASFIEMARGYWPLYAEVAGDGRVRSGGEMAAFAGAQTWGRIREFPLLAAAAIGALAGATAIARRDRTSACAIAVLFAWTGAYAFYIYYGGKTWYYHAHPLYLTLALLTGLSVLWLSPDGPIAAPLGRVAAAAGLLVLLALPTVHTAGPPDLARVRAVSGYLDTHLEPGDRVLPLDTTTGALHAMLLSEASMASSFLYSFHFYHHPEQPYIRALRRRLLREIDQQQPRFIVRATGGWRIEGPDGPARFPELERRIARDYRLALRHHDGLDVLERVDSRADAR